MRKVFWCMLSFLTMVSISCSANTNQQGTTQNDSSSGDCKSGYIQNSNKFFYYCVNKNKSSDILFLSLNGYNCMKDNGSSLITTSNESSYKNASITKICNNGICPVKSDVATDIKDIDSSTTSTSLYLTTTTGKNVNCTMSD